MQHDESESNLFSLSTLEFSFQLLRVDYPSLALELQNLIVEAKQGDKAHLMEDYDNFEIELNLDVEEVSTLVSAISEIAEKASRNEFHSKKNLVSIHATLLDWLLYAQSFTYDLQPLKLDPQLKTPNEPSKN